MHELLGSASVFAAVVTAIVNEALGKVSGDHALTLGQLRFLELIEQGGESNMTDIARSIAISNAAVSRTVDKLVDRGLVARRAGSEDRRIIWLDLTDSGDTVLADYRARIESSLIRSLQQESAGQLSEMALTLDRMTRTLLDAQEGEPPPCRGCIACNLFRRAECPLGTGRPHAACHSEPAATP
ncbi:MAG: MarR family winged helix-turn-helix transcriptional regulator [Candidatus Longimicrobiales bacterium M2_2A_002]